MATQKEWEAEAAKVNRLTRFSKKAQLVLALTGIVIALIVFVAYYFAIKPIELNLAGAKTSIVSVLLGFSVSSALTGMIVSLYASSVDEGILSKPQDPNKVPEAKALGIALKKSKEELKHYFQIAAVLLFLNAFKEILSLFLG